MPEIAIFVGTRPEIIKMAPVIWDLRKRASLNVPIVHTGQHYDSEMSEQFIRELDIPEPSQFLGVGSGSQGQQLSKVVVSAENYLTSERIDLAVVEGDTNSALGVALAASKNNIPLAHVEAGCRSFDKTMPEEINRVLIADCADLNLAPTKNCLKNLQNEGIPDARIYLSGHPIVTLLTHVRGDIIRSDIRKQLHLKKRGYVLVTTHRQENVDSPQQLRSILESLEDLPTTVVLPIHPRTKKNLAAFKLAGLLKRLRTTKPLGYLDTLRLILDAEAVITDSGGIQQEAFLLGTPCLTIRKTTEWIETVEKGGNFLVKRPTEIAASFSELRRNHSQILDNIHKAGDVFGDVNSAARISEALVKKQQEAC